MLTASDSTIALVWYYCDTKRGHFCYYEDFQKKRDTKQTDIWYYAAIKQLNFYYYRRISYDHR